MNKKIAVIGAGNVGASCAMYLAEANFADIVLVDIIPDMPKGKGLDLTQAGPVRGLSPGAHSGGEMGWVSPIDSA